MKYNIFSNNEKKERVDQRFLFQVVDIIKLLN